MRDQSETNHRPRSGQYKKIRLGTNESQKWYKNRGFK